MIEVIDTTGPQHYRWSRADVGERPPAWRSVAHNWWLLIAGKMAEEECVAAISACVTPALGTMATIRSADHVARNVLYRLGLHDLLRVSVGLSVRDGVARLLVTVRLPDAERGTVAP